MAHINSVRLLAQGRMRRTGDGGRTLVHCHAGCSPQAIVAALGLRLADLFAGGHQVGRGVHPPENGATVQPPGCTLAAYAAEKWLPPEFLQGLGVTDARCAS